MSASPEPGATKPPSAPGLPPSPRLVLGRDELLDRLCTKLAQSPAPAIALLGPGGIGKSTITLRALHRPEVAARFGARRWFVRLDAAPTAEAALALVATTLGLQPQQPQQPLLPAVCRFLEEAPGVLALDNLETPWEGEPQETEELLQALKAAPGLALIVSLRGAQSPDDLDVEAIDVPPLDQIAASKLFCRISRKEPDDPSLAPLLALLDGVPLAITLLAHVAQGTSLAGVLAEWRRKRTALLARKCAKPGRGTSWASSMALSIRSLRMTNDARRLLALLGRLPDGVAVEDLDALLPEGGLTAGRDLIQVGLAYDDHDRVRVLAPVREYAREKLISAPSDLAAARDRYGMLAKTQGPRAGKEGGAEAIARLTPEAANLDAMLREGLESTEPARWVDASVALTEFVRFSGHSSPSPLEAALKAARKMRDPIRQAKCLESLGHIALGRSEYGKARRYYEQALPLYGEGRDVPGKANCIFSLGQLALRRSDHDEAKLLFDKARTLYRRVDGVLGEANCIQSLGELALARSDHEGARQHYDGARSLYHRVGSVLGEANCIQSLGDIARERSDHGEARRCYEQARPLYREVGSVVGEANCIQSLGDLALARSHHDEAHRHYEEARLLYRKAGLVSGEADCIRSLGDIARVRSDYEGARRHYDEALSLYCKVGPVQGEANCIQSLGHIARERPDPAAAKEHYQTALSLYTRLPEPYSMGVMHCCLARLAADASEKQDHVASARELWTQINRPDLVAELDAEFGHKAPLVGTKPDDAPVRASQGPPNTKGKVRAERQPSVAPPGEPAPAVAAGRPTRVFVSCSRSEADAAYLTELETRLVPFERSAAIEVWHRGRAQAGAEVAREVAERLEAADVVLLLVSPESLASSDCHDDMSRALERREGGGRRSVTMVPILIRPVSHLPEPLGALQHLPKGDKAISQWLARDDAWVDVIKSLQPLLKKREPGGS